MKQEPSCYAVILTVRPPRGKERTFAAHFADTLEEARDVSRSALRRPGGEVVKAVIEARYLLETRTRETQARHDADPEFQERQA